MSKVITPSDPRYSLVRPWIPPNLCNNSVGIRFRCEVSEVDDCPNCGGTGETYSPVLDHVTQVGEFEYHTCEVCGGTGKRVNSDGHEPERTANTDSETTSSPEET